MFYSFSFLYYYDVSAWEKYIHGLLSISLENNSEIVLSLHAKQALLRVQRTFVFSDSGNQSLVKNGETTTTLSSYPNT